MRVYDPRDKQWKESINPALMMAQFMIDGLAPAEFAAWVRENEVSAGLMARGFRVGSEIDWQAVAAMADAQDQT
jgi:hypothetical protein